MSLVCDTSRVFDCRSVCDRRSILMGLRISVDSNWWSENWEVRLGWIWTGDLLDLQPDAYPLCHQTSLSCTVVFFLGNQKCMHAPIVSVENRDVARNFKGEGADNWRLEMLGAMPGKSSVFSALFGSTCPVTNSREWRMSSSYHRRGQWGGVE